MTRRKPRRAPVDMALLVTAQRLTKGDELVVEETASAGQRRVRNRTQTMMDRYLHHREINEDQHDTGGKIHALWRASECSELRAAGWEPSLGGSGILADGQAAARENLNRIMARAGMAGSAILVRVCICDDPAGRGNVGFLRDALDLAGGLTRRR